MAKYDVCVASTKCTAAGVAIATQGALFFGIASTGGATVGGITIHAGTAAGTAPLFHYVVTATAGKNEGPPVPIVCAGGLYASVVGTGFNFVVYYSINT